MASLRHHLLLKVRPVGKRPRKHRFWRDSKSGGPSAAEPEGDPGQGGDEDGEDGASLPGLGTDPVADPLGSEPRPLGL
jgi:hypothetical protein